MLDVLPGELFLMKYEDSQQYGGPEEGGWWYNHAEPQWRFRLRHALCRWLNNRENRKPHEYDYTSVLSYREEFFSFGLEDGFKPINPARPHYE